MLKYKEKDLNDELRKLELLKNITIENGATSNEVKNANALIVKIEDKIEKRKSQDSTTKQNDKDINKTIINNNNNNNKELFHKNIVNDDTKPMTSTDINTHSKSTSYNTQTKRYFVCPVCGNDQFYHGSRGGLSQNILCDNCFTEFNHSPIHTYKINTKMDLDRFFFCYGDFDALQKAKCRNYTAYKRIVSNSSLYQKIKYLGLKSLFHKSPQRLIKNDCTDIIDYHEA